MRALRQGPQPNRSDQPQVHPQRRSTRAARDLAVVPAHGPPRRLAQGMGGNRQARRRRPPQPGRLEKPRTGPVPLVDRRWTQSTRHDPRLGLGRTRSGRRRRRQSAVCVARRPHRLHLGHPGMGAPKRQGLGTVLEGRRHPTGALHWQGQHCVPLHHLPHPAQGARRLHPAHQRAGQRVHELGERQDLHQPQLGGVAARVPGRIPGKTRRIALRALRHHARAARQRVHLDRLPRPRQQRIGRRARQLHEPRGGAHPQVLRRRGAHPKCPAT